MVELFLTALLPLILLPHIAAGYLAKHTGRSFWFWFGISFILPVVSLMILVMLKDKSKPEIDKEG